MRRLRVLVTVFDAMNDPGPGVTRGQRIAVAFFDEHESFMYDRSFDASRYDEVTAMIERIVNEHAFVKVYGEGGTWSGAEIVDATEAARSTPQFQYRRSWIGAYDAQGHSSRSPIGDLDVLYNLDNFVDPLRWL